MAQLFFQVLGISFTMSDFTFVILLVMIISILGDTAERFGIVAED